MLHRLIPMVLFALAGAPGAPPHADPPTEESFRTEAAPRIDPVFGDVASLRAAIDRFLSLQGEMERVRDDFSSAVHAALATLVGPPSPAPQPAAAKAAASDAHPCPAAAATPLARASLAGGRYLALGQQLQAAYREIRRGDDLGDTVGLTPDYRLKAKKARALHQQLLSDYREMRVAFYDQLGAEIRHAGCRLPARTTASSAPDSNPADNPLDLRAWDLGESPADLGGDPPAPALNKEGAATTAAQPPSAPLAADGEASSPAIWIDIDNTLCNEATRLSIDGQAVGDIGARNKTSVRTRSGPHEVCALPTSDKRACGDAGTLRKAYLHEGWRLTIHCAK